MNKVGKGLLALALALSALVAAPGTAHASAPATTSSSYCKLEVVSLHATNLWHDGAKDWIWLVVGGAYFPTNTRSVQFLLGTTQSTTAFGQPVYLLPSGGSAVYQVVLDRTWPTPNLVIDSNTLSCATTGSSLSARFSDGDATYDLTYSADLV